MLVGRLLLALFAVAILTLVVLVIAGFVDASTSAGGGCGGG